MVKWSEMLDEIIYEVANHLPPDVEEFARFSSVSKSWRSSAITLNQHKIIQCAPWLLLAKTDNDKLVNADNEDGIRSFYSVSSKKVFNLQLPTQGRRCWGTPYSWLFTMGLDLNINLFNPFSGVQIPLPPQPTFEHQYRVHVVPERLCANFVNKIALASNPSSWNSNASASTAPVVMVTYGEFCYLAMATPGDEAWISFEGDLGINVSDIIFYNGHIYVVNRRAEVGICDITTSPPIATLMASPPESVPSTGDRYYLVEMSGNLYMVSRVFRSNYGGEEETEHGNEEEQEQECESENEDETELEDGGEAEEKSEPEDGDEEETEPDNEYETEAQDGGEEEEKSESEQGDEEETEPEDAEDDYIIKTEYFLVFKFDFHTRKWVEVNDLDGNAFFVGNNQSFAISTARYSEFRGNCIYFTDDNDELYDWGFCDMGAYDMGKGLVEPIYIKDNNISSFSRPVFFMPTP